MITTISVGSGASPTQLGVTPNSDYLYVANSNANNVSVISTSTKKVTTTIPTGSHPYPVAVSPDGTKVFVGNLLGNSISVISTATNTVTNTISLPSGATPRGLAINPGGTELYVADATGFLYVINTSTLAILTTLDISGGVDGTTQKFPVTPKKYPRGREALGRLALTLDGNFLYVVNYALNRVVMVETDLDQVVGLPIPASGPYDVEVAPNGKILYVVNRSASNIAVVDISQ